MTGGIATCARSDLDLGTVQSSYGRCSHRLKQQALPSPSKLCCKGNNPLSSRRLEKLVCYSQANVMEFGSNETSRVTSTTENLKLFDDNASLLPLLEFKMSDFELCTNVSVGLAARGDEVVYEAIVRNPDSPLKGSKVVPRQLAGSRAQRWRKHAMQVITKLVRRAVMYQSYATQIYGYILPYGVDKNVLTLVHGYYDDYSLHHRLLCENWLPTLESRLTLDEECGRRVGDNRTGGPAVSRQLRLIQIVMRDLLIGVNYLHSHGFAHTELRLQNVHISEVDRHIKVCAKLHRGFNSSLSFTAMLVNFLKIRINVKTFHLRGMGCSVGLISLGLARDLLIANCSTARYALVVASAEVMHTLYDGSMMAGKGL